MSGQYPTLEQLVQERDRLYQSQFDALREAMAAAIQTQRESVSAAFLASEKAIEKAERANDKHFDSVNEFRATLSDQQRNLLPREEAMVRFEHIDREMDSREREISEMRLAMTKFLTLETYNLRHEELVDAVRALERTLAAQKAAEQGGKEASVDMRTLITFAVGIVLALVSIAAFGISLAR